MPTLTEKRKRIHPTHPIGGRQYRGLMPNGRIALNMAANTHCKALLEQGCYSIRTIARECKMTQCQITYRARLMGISIKDHRDGKTKESRVVLKKFRIRYA
jgi:hypothetical protein